MMTCVGHGGPLNSIWLLLTVDCFGVYCPDALKPLKIAIKRLLPALVRDSCATREEDDHEQNCESVFHRQQRSSCNEGLGVTSSHSDDHRTSQEVMDGATLIVQQHGNKLAPEPDAR